MSTDTKHTQRRQWGVWKYYPECSALEYEAPDTEAATSPRAVVRLADCGSADGALAEVERIARLLPFDDGRVLGDLVQALCDLLDPFRPRTERPAPGALKATV
jgi:hypothetical protein